MQVLEKHRLTLGQLRSAEQLAVRLSPFGLRESSAASKAKQFAQVAQHLSKLGTGENEPVYACYVPGRIEVLGKHTDYAGGRSLLAAVERGFYLIATALGDKTVHMTDVADGSNARFTIDAELSPEHGHWSNYPMTVARRVARNFPGDVRGARIGFISDLPPAAGMSSSSAMIIATFLALAQTSELEARGEFRSNIDSLEALAGYAATIENGANFGTLTGDTGVGTFGGSEDHTAILGCQAGKLAQYRFCPVRPERTINMPGGYTLAIAASGVLAEKTGDAQAKYNRASKLASVAIETWQQAAGHDDPHLAAAIERSADAPQRIRDVLAAVKNGPFTTRELLDRFEQFLTENQVIIPAAGDALHKDDLNAFGDLVDRSQAGAEKLLGNQVPETIHLARSARQLGAVAASAFGAGFGGSVWAMVKTNQSADFLNDWSRDYRTSFPDAASAACFFTTSAGPAAFAVPGD